MKNAEEPNLKNILEKDGMAFSYEKKRFPGAWERLYFR